MEKEYGPLAEAVGCREAERIIRNYIRDTRTLREWLESDAGAAMREVSLIDGRAREWSVRISILGQGEVITHNDTLVPAIIGQPYVGGQTLRKFSSAEHASSVYLLANQTLGFHIEEYIQNVLYPTFQRLVKRKLSFDPDNAMVISNEDHIMETVITDICFDLQYSYTGKKRRRFTGHY